MARHLIQNAATGETRIVGDAALPFFPGFAIVDTYDDGIPPVVFYGAGESDLRYVNVTELSDPASAASVALRAASVAAAKAEFAPQFGAAKPAGGTLADVQAIPNLKWLFTPDTGFFSDVAGTTRQTAGGGSVKCWKDGSPNADHAKDATGLTLATGIGAGTDALAVAGSTNRLRTTGTFDASFNAGFTVFAVVHHPTIAANQVIAASGDGRWYHAWNGSNQGHGAVMSATGNLPNPTIPVDVATAANTAAPRPGIQVECFRYNGPSTPADVFYDGYWGTGASATSATAAALTGVLNIGGLTGGFAWGGNIIALAIFNRALTNTEVQRVNNYLSAVSKARAKPLVQCIGNSLTAGTGASLVTAAVPAIAGVSTAGYAKRGNTDYPSQLLDAYPADDVIIRTDAYPGRTDQQIAAEMGKSTLAAFDPAAHRKRIAVVWELTNDLATNIDANLAALNAGTVPPAYTNYVALLTTLRDQGWIVGAVTCLPRGDITPSSKQGWFFRAYQEINTLLRQNWQDHAHFIVDLAADPRLGFPGAEQSTTYFNADKVHLNDAGYTIVKTKVKAAVDRFLV